MTVLEKIARIKKLEVKEVALEEEALIVFTTTCNKVVVGVREEDEEGYNWKTRVLNI